MDGEEEARRQRQREKQRAALEARANGEAVPAAKRKRKPIGARKFEVCRAALAESLTLALDDLGGLANRDNWDVDESLDAIQHRAIGLSSVPAIHWQNRPTFQQVVEFTNHR